MAQKQNPDWRDGPYGPLAQDRMDEYERARLAGELPPVRSKPLAADDPRFAENKAPKKP